MKNAARLIGLIVLHALLSPSVPAAEGLPFTPDSPVYQVSPSAALDLRDEVTLEAWVQADAMGAGGGRILDKTPPGSQDGYLLDT